MKKKNYTHTYINLKNAKYSLSPNTIKIPEMYRSFLVKRISEYITFNFYVHKLIVKYSYLILEGKIKPYTGIKTLYQDKGLNLFPVKFRNYDDSDWSVLKILANCLNVSRCKLIVMLIEFDMAGIEEGIVATNKSTDIGYQELYNFQKSILLRTKIIFNLRNGKIHPS